MNFRRGRNREEPEINFIPLIDVLLVILIFLMVTTTYSRPVELNIQLPTGQGETLQRERNEIVVTLTRAGQVSIAGKLIDLKQRDVVRNTLKTLAQNRPETIVSIQADALATHQSVVSVMEAAREAGLTQLSFALNTR